MSTSAVAVREPTALERIRDGLQEKRSDIESVIPVAAGLTYDRLIGVAIEGLTRQPQLLQCTRESVIRAVYQSATLGLEPTGLLGSAYLVPFRNKKSGKLEAQLIVGYKGMVELADRTAGIHIEAEAVYEGESFSRRRVAGRTVIDHETRLDVERTDERITDVYAIAHFPDGFQQSVAMTRDEVEAIRRKYSRGGNDSAWVTAWGPMAKKTVIRQLASKLPQRVQRLFDQVLGREDSLAGLALPAPAPEAASRTVEVRRRLAERTRSRRQQPDEGGPNPAPAEGSAAGAAAPEAQASSGRGEPGRRASEAASAPLAEVASDTYDDATPAEFTVEEVNEVIDGATPAGELWQGREER
jgi:recombination protein RecT